MNSELLQAFIEEVENYLPVVRGAILVCSQKAVFQEDLSLSLRHVQTIKGAAQMVDLPEIVKRAEILETELEVIVSAKQSPTDTQTRRLLESVAQIETLLVKMSFETGDFSTFAAKLVEESFENPSIEEAKDTNEIADGGEDFEIDEEMLEIFAAEAEDLLRSIGSNLEILEKTPDNREALLEIRRNAHTLKGSAGIIGLKKLSNLAHRVEDLLDFLSENEVGTDRQIFELLLTATDCLSALTSNENSAQLTKKIEQIEKGFDEILNNTKKESAAESKSFEIIQKTDDKSQSSNPKSVVRVSQEKLDDLVSLVGEMVISRSMFEQRLAELGGQIEELENSTRRLQRSTGKLETGFEAETANEGAKRRKDERENVSINNNSQYFPASSTANLPFSPSQFDALEFDRYTEFHQTVNDLVEMTGDTLSINSELENLRSGLETLSDYQRSLVEEIQDKLLRLRMVTFGSLSARLQRTVRVTADQDGKMVQLCIEGENLELDTQILDALAEPLLHLLRNAVAHGIESPETRRMLGKAEIGNINLHIRLEGMQVVLTVSDDGRGISVEALKKKAVRDNFISVREAEVMSETEALELIFLPGLTTAAEINYVSGRGVGLNIVKTNVERQKGTISVNSKSQKGASFTIRLPLSRAVTRALLVKTGGQTFAFPINLVERLTEVPAENLAENLTINKTKYPVLHLSELLNLPRDTKTESIPLLLIETLESRYALAIDEALKAEEIIIKPLGFLLNSLPEFAGATVLGDGSVVPVLDLFYLLNSKNSSSKFQTEKPEKNELTAKTEVKNPEIPLIIMIVDDSPSVRHVNSKLIENAGMLPVTAKDGLEALEILQSFEELPDVILTDVEMPRIDGYELLAALKRQDKLRRIPVIMLTSRSSEKHRQKAFELGVSEYLSKPYEEKDLLDKIKILAKSE